MANEQQQELTKEFVNRIRAAAGENVLSVILYGSAAEGEFHPYYSDLNLLCLLHDASFAAIAKFSDVLDWWRKKKLRPPLIVRLQELMTSADVFSIEFVDMKQRYRVLFGDDVLQMLNVPMVLHRFQLEYELREKILLLRQHLVVAGNNEKQLWEVMLHSLSSFTTLFRHVLLELGEQGGKHSRDAVTQLSARLNFEALPFVQLMDVRAERLDRKQLQASDVAAQYLSAIEKVVCAVDTMLGSES